MDVFASPRLELERNPRTPKPSPGDPAFRYLRIFAIDPLTRSDDGGIATLRLRYEPLEPGPCGTLFKVNMADRDKGKTHPPAELDDARVLVERGLTPSMSSRAFAGQMVYAVAMSLYDVFEEALGRELPLGLHRGAQGEWKGGTGLILQPFAMQDAQASFHPDLATIRFGYAQAREASSGYSPDAEVYSCLSHDIVVHELTHAFIHAVRPNLMAPCNPDVLALHEAIADLVSILQRLRYRDFVYRNIETAGYAVETWDWLGLLARNFSQAIGYGHSLRQLRACEQLDKAGNEPHARGLVLVQAVFSAFEKILTRRFEEIVLLASAGRGQLDEGRMAPVVVEAMTRETQKAAGHILNMVIRALDYMQPIAPTFGDYLRALITADKLLVPLDDRRYRQIFIDAFRERGIYPTRPDGSSSAMHMTEDGLACRPLERGRLVIEPLAFSASGFNGQPEIHDAEAARDHDRRVAASLSACEELAHLLSVETDTQVELISIAPYRKLGPENRVLSGSICELAWRGGKGSRLKGGATLLVDNDGQVDYIFSAPTLGDAAEARELAEQNFLLSSVGRRFWNRNAEDKPAPRTSHFALLCRASGVGQATRNP